MNNCTDIPSIPHMGKLILVAGLPGAGKTTIISKIRNGSMSSLQEILGNYENSEWTYMIATQLDNCSIDNIRYLVLHYDLFAQRLPSGYRYLPELTQRFGQVIIVTLIASSCLLSLRNGSRLIKHLIKFIVNNNKNRSGLKIELAQCWQKQKIYMNNSSVAELYADWFRYSGQFLNFDHWLLDSSALTRNVINHVKFSAIQLNKG